MLLTVASPCRWVLASSEAPAATAEADGPYELVSAEHWQLLSMYYGPDSEEGGGGRKRWRKQPLGDQLAGLLERGIAATLVVDTPPGAAADGSPGAAGGEQPAAAAAANGVAAAAPPPQRGPPQRGRAAALVAEATAAAADSGSDVDLLDELTIGSEQNPYKLNRRPNVRSGERAKTDGCRVIAAWWGDLLTESWRCPTEASNTVPCMSAFCTFAPCCAC